jgi:hypothetical protein
MAIIEKVNTLFAKLRRIITLWALDLIKFTEKIIEPDQASKNHVYLKRIISTTNEAMEVELMANLRLEYSIAG